MAYTPTIWKDGEAPAINAENLNKMEQGIVGAQQTADEAQQAIANDPLGVWKYAGKLTKGNSEILLQNVNIQDINEIIVKVNEFKITSESGGKGGWQVNFQLEEGSNYKTLTSVSISDTSTDYTTIANNEINYLGVYRSLRASVGNSNKAYNGSSPVFISFGSTSMKFYYFNGVVSNLSGNAKVYIYDVTLDSYDIDVYYR